MLFTPKIQLKLWIKTEQGIAFGRGRAILLSLIDKHGSLRKAAEELGMSYRGAWGKIKKTEEILGQPLVEKLGSNREGYKLTQFGRELMEGFWKWHYAVEEEACKMAQEYFPWKLEKQPPLKNILTPKKNK